MIRWKFSGHESNRVYSMIECIKDLVFMIKNTEIIFLEFIEGMKTIGPFLLAQEI